MATTTTTMLQQRNGSPSSIGQQQSQQADSSNNELIMRPAELERMISAMGDSTEKNAAAAAAGAASGNEKTEHCETDMDEQLQQACVQLVREAQKLYSQDKEVAAYVKEELDKRLGGTWHVVVGRNFGSRVSYEINHFLLFKVNKTSVMIFKCGY